MSTNDKTEIGLTENSQKSCTILNNTGYFKNEVNAAFFALIYALKNKLFKENNTKSKKTTKWHSTALIDDNTKEWLKKIYSQIFNDESTNIKINEISERLINNAFEDMYEKYFKDGKVNVKNIKIMDLLNLNSDEL